MKYSTVWTLCVMFAGGLSFRLEEKSCVSRFDYEFKVVQKLAELEQRNDELKQMVEDQQKAIGPLLRDNTGTNFSFL